MYNLKYSLRNYKVRSSLEKLGFTNEDIEGFLSKGYESLSTPKIMKILKKEISINVVIGIGTAGITIGMSNFINVISRKNNDSNLSYFSNIDIITIGVLLVLILSVLIYYRMTVKRLKKDFEETKTESENGLKMED